MGQRKGTYSAQLFRPVIFEMCTPLFPIGMAVSRNVLKLSLVLTKAIIDENLPLH